MKKTTVVLFDLDGTLLPMDTDAFVARYFQLLTAKLAPRGYEPKALMAAIWAGTGAMVRNNGRATNEAVFWQAFADACGAQVLEDKPIFEDFYLNEFQAAQALCTPNPLAAATVRDLRDLGFRVALATNPLFPAIATESRVRWAGLTPQDFELVTTYENSSYAKPNPAYYLEIAKALGVAPEDCIMVGNDVSEDMVAKRVGMQVFLLTDCLINKENRDISLYPNGSFEELVRLLTADT